MHLLDAERNTGLCLTESFAPICVAGTGLLRCADNDASAESFAERMRCGRSSGDMRVEKTCLIAEKYRGIRPAPGYPACPDHSEKETLFHLLDAERNTGLCLTESDHFYFAQSCYFGVGRIMRDQVRDYARRKGWSLESAEKWLQPNLAYASQVRVF